MRVFYHPMVQVLFWCYWFLAQCFHFIFFSDPIGNGTASNKQLNPTPVDDLVAVSSKFFSSDQIEDDVFCFCLENVAQLYFSAGRAFGLRYQR